MLLFFYWKIIMKLELKTIWTERAKKAKERLAVCDTCDRYDGLTCKECGCVMKLKTMFPTSKCPLNKWSSYKDEDNDG